MSIQVMERLWLYHLLKILTSLSSRDCDLIIPLWAKQVGEFIEIRHKKISPTRILSTLGCLWLCGQNFCGSLWTMHNAMITFFCISLGLAGQDLWAKKHSFVHLSQPSYIGLSWNFELRLSTLANFQLFSSHLVCIDGPIGHQKPVQTAPFAGGPWNFPHKFHLYFILQELLISMNYKTVMVYYLLI